MGYEWYADVFFLTGFLMDAAGVFAAAACCGRPLRIGRTLIVCALSVLAGMALFVFAADFTVCRLVVHLAVNPVMVAVIFWPVGRRDFFRLIVTVYLVLFLAGGVQASALAAFGAGGGGRTAVCGLLAAAAFCVYMLRYRTLRFVCTVDLWLGGEKVTVSAYCDSANLLRNPRDGKPVSILQREALGKWNIQALPTEQVPCRTISEDGFYLDVVTLDKMDIYMRGTLKRIRSPEIGLRTGPPMRRPPVQLLLHSSYLG